MIIVMIMIMMEHMEMKILKNKAKCTRCGTILESYSPNIRINCKCGNLTISGGSDGLIRESSDYEELSEYLLTE